MEYCPPVTPVKGYEADSWDQLPGMLSLLCGAQLPQLSGCVVLIDQIHKLHATQWTYKGGSVMYNFKTQVWFTIIIHSTSAAARTWKNCYGVKT